MEENTVLLYKADVVAARILVMCLFMPPQMQVLAAIGTSVYFVFRSLRSGLRPTAFDLRWAAVLGGSYFLYVIALFFTPERNSAYAHMLCEQKSAYLLLPFVFAIIGQPFRLAIVNELRFFVYGCIITCSLANVDYLYNHFMIGGPGRELSHVAYRNIFENFTGIHPTYMAMYLCFALYITIFRFITRSRRDVFAKYAMVYTLLVFMLALFAKSPIIALVLAAAHFLISDTRMIARLKWVFLSLVGVVAGAYAFIPFFRQRVLELSGLFSKKGSDDLIQNSVNMRKLLFHTDKTMLQHYWLTGTGPGTMLVKLHYRYFFHSVYRGYWVGYFDPHNQYFYDWLSFGIAGIAAMAIVLFVQFRRAVLSRNVIYLYLLITIGVTFFTESLLARQQGVLFYSIFTSLMFFAAAPKPARTNN